MHRYSRWKPVTNNQAFHCGGTPEKIQNPEQYKRDCEVEKLMRLLKDIGIFKEI